MASERENRKSFILYIHLLHKVGINTPVCIYIRTYVCVYVCMYVCMYVCVCIYIYLYTHVCIYICVQVHAYMRAITYTGVLSMFACMWDVCMHECAHACIYVSAHAFNSFETKDLQQRNVDNTSLNFTTRY